MVNISTLQVLIDSDAQKKKKNVQTTNNARYHGYQKCNRDFCKHLWGRALLQKFKLLDIRFLRGLDSPFTFDHHAKLFFLFFELYDSKYRVDFSLEQGVIKKTHLFYCLICWRIQNPVKHL